MGKPVNRQIILAARPHGHPKASDFEIVERPVPVPGDGQVLIRNLLVSLDPYNRIIMGNAGSELPPIEPIAIGDPMFGFAIAVVEQSNNPAFAPGDHVASTSGWQDYALSDGSDLRVIDPDAAPLSANLGALGMTGLTAWVGLTEVLDPKPGGTLVVTAAAGAVGSVAGQIAKLAGCRTVGIAGGADKCDDLRDLYGFDAAIDYKSDDVRAALKAACPDGVDVYFDNVGGATTQALIPRLNLRARIVICGQISQYNLDRPEPTFHPSLLIVYRARMEGFLVTDYAHRYDEAAVRLARWVAEGKIKWREDVTEGLENAPAAFMGMLRGENRGKALVKVAERGG